MTGLVPSYQIPQGELLQHVSSNEYAGTPLYFGRSANRFDSPDDSYGVMYLGQTLATALMESVFHDHRWSSVKTRTIAYSEVQRRLVRVARVKTTLRLADLMAPNVMAAQFGLNLAQLSSRRYRRLRSISQAIHGATSVVGGPFDGIRYPSRNNYPDWCVALFERAAPKIEWVGDLELVSHKDWPVFVSNFKVGIVPL